MKVQVITVKKVYKIYKNNKVRDFYANWALLKYFFLELSWFIHMPSKMLKQT